MSQRQQVSKRRRSAKKKFYKHWKKIKEINKAIKKKKCRPKLE